jgi:hypothetical protein
VRSTVGGGRSERLAAVALSLLSGRHYPSLSTRFQECAAPSKAGSRAVSTERNPSAPGSVQRSKANDARDEALALAETRREVIADLRAQLASSEESRMVLTKKSLARFFVAYLPGIRV